MTLVNGDAPRAKSRLVRHDVRERLQNIILSGERPPGAKLRQQELAAHFGVAQGVIREALLELQAYGLVETIDNRGVYVSRIDREKLLESFEVREMHEGLAARLCCERVTRGQIKSLVELAHQVYDLAVAGNSQEMASQDRVLHAKLIHLSGNSMLIRLADNYRVLGKIVRANRDAVAVRDEHLEILRAIEENRADDAERLMRAHVAAARLAVAESLKDGAFTPEWVV